MDYLHFHACLHGHRPVITDLAHGRQWDYQSFDRLVGQVAHWLIRLGCKPGERIACLALNRAELVALQLAAARIGAIFVPLNWRLSASEITQLISDCQPQLLLGDADNQQLLADVPQACYPLTDLFDEVADLGPLRPAPMDVNLPSLMLYTSGTSGTPKGVLLSERALTETGINFGLLGEVDEHSVFLAESPMFHIIGMVTSIRPALLHGAHIVISERFIPERTLARMADATLAISHYFCVPQMALALRAVEHFDPAALANLKAIFTGGAPHPEAQIRQWLNDGIAIVDGYGMSEAGTVFGMPLKRELIDAKAGCVGLPTPRVQARLVDEQGAPTAPGQPGELQLKGDNLACGYWQREADFNAAFTSDGWFRTDDVLQQDSDGYFRVTDRKKDMYISGGENVYPAEVEAQLCHYPGIKELAIAGVPDERWGEVGCLFYVPEANTNLEAISLADIEQFLTTKLARYKIPKRLQAIEALPRNGVGKVQKHLLKPLLKE